ncbi:uncharacterized protein LOC132714710 [Ruditapes philippinarum]|uniref:uncharacterized protein LOC132714710 n=1 Tax=Ruditapes philippinarum TaxID=129788 RepID=UPI00295B2007|nr:uncharacterized protein LOC132714710 [Ruditapes philippinarum]
MLLWAKQLNLLFPSSTRFHGIQRCYMIPAIESAWDENVQEVRSEFQNRDIILMGDGRNDSPGHSAQYCSYTFMEYDTKKIISLLTIDKRQTERKSVNMEKRGFIQALNEIKDSGLSVKEVVTDAHLGISSVMKKQYPDVKHSYDIWHVAKNLGKKIVKASQKKQNMVLMKWSRDIINHFWFSCQKAESYSEFVGIWRSVLHHITNKHEWIIPHGGLYQCLHDPLGEDESRSKPWLHPEKDSHVLKELANIVLDKRLLKNVEHFLNFRSTAELEGFHQHILMYCAKRFAYTPPVYRARNLLAALDHNKNASRGEMKNKDGSTRYHRTYNKKSGRWSVYACKEPKSFDYIQEVLVKALMNRLNDTKGMYRKVTLDPTDVRLISKTIAPVEPPSTQQLVQEKKSRYN